MGRIGDRRRVCFQEGVKYPPIECLISDYGPTLDGYHRAAPGENRWVFLAADGARTVPGDGSVSLAAAHPPNGVPHGTTVNHLPHVDVLSDLENVEALLCKMQAAAAVESAQ